MSMHTAQGVYIDKNRIKKEMRHKTVGSKFVHTERENVTKYFFFVSGSQHGSWQDSAPARKVMLEDRAGKHGHDDPRDKVETFKPTRLKYCTEF